MELITAQDPEAESADIVADNIEKLRALFPELITEGPNGDSVNVDVLKQLVGEQTVVDAEERYGLNWYGRRAARRLALTPSSGTLRPVPDESLEWDRTHNLMIEGDNLEVLKLLQKSYGGRVKLIYIDPPYNTGKDFVYSDNFGESIRNYKQTTGQLEGNTALTSNPETSGRFHTNWLNMMYPRLLLARELMAKDGLIFVSIHDKEIHNLRLMMDSVFGEDNFVECYVWVSTFRPDNSSKIYRKNAQYVVCYAREIGEIDELIGEVIQRTGLPSLTKASMAPSVLTFPERSVEFAIPDGSYSPGERGTYILLDEVVVKKGTNENAFRLKGPSIWGQDNLNRELEDGTIIRIKTKGFVPYVDKGSEGSLRPAKLIPSKIVGDVLGSATEMRQLMGDDVFSYPKPVSLLQYLLRFRKGQDVVLDFFAGSGTTGHAVIAQNAEDGEKRRYILVQLPEPLSSTNDEQKTAAEYCEKLGLRRTLAELTKERLRRAAEKVRTEHSDYDGDLGFRVYQLDSSNIRAWDPDAEDFAQTLLSHVEHIRPERTEHDVLAELLLKLGIDLCVPIEVRDVAGKTVHSVGAGTLFVSLSEQVAREEAETLAHGIAGWRNEMDPASDTTVVFRDSAFADDVAKSNAAAILNQHGIETVRSL